MNTIFWQKLDKNPVFNIQLNLLKQSVFLSEKYAVSKVTTSVRSAAESFSLDTDPCFATRLLPCR